MFLYDLIVIINIYIGKNKKVQGNAFVLSAFLLNFECTSDHV